MRALDKFTKSCATLVATYKNDVLGYVCVSLNREIPHQAAWVVARTVKDFEPFTTMKLVEEGFNWASAQRVVNYYNGVLDEEFPMFQSLGYQVMHSTSAVHKEYRELEKSPNAYVVHKRSVNYFRDLIRVVPDYKVPADPAVPEMESVQELKDKWSN